MSIGAWAEGDLLTPDNMNNRGGGPFSSTSLVNVSWSMFSASKNTTSIQSAILYAGTNNYAGIVIPQAYLPYDTSTISDVYSVQRFWERGPWDKWDVRAYGAAGNGVDDTAALTAAVAAAPSGAVVWFGETGTFSITTTLAPIGTTKTLRFEGHYTERSGVPLIRGSVAGPIIKIYGAGGSLGGERGCFIKGLGIQNTSTSTLASCIDLQNVMDAVIEGCYIRGGAWGIILRGSVMDSSVRNCSIQGPGNNVDSVGLFTAGHSHIESVTLTSWGHALRLQGSGPVSVVNGRMEVNTIACEVGFDINNVSSGGGDIALLGSSWEGNDVGLIIGGGITNNIFAGLSIRGTASAPSGAGQSGIRITGGCNYTTFEGIAIGGSFTTNAFAIEHDVAFSSIRNCFASNTGSGSTWSYVGTPLGWTFENCNAPAIVVPLSTNSTTPTIHHTVSGGGTIFKTASTSTTTITQFTNGIVGVPFSLQAVDNKTGIQHGTNIFLKGGADLSMTSGNVIRLMQFSSERWDEI